MFRLIYLFVLWFMCGCGPSLPAAEAQRLTTNSLTCLSHQITLAKKVKEAGGNCYEQVAALEAMVPEDESCKAIGLTEVAYQCTVLDGGADVNRD